MPANSSSIDVINALTDIAPDSRLADLRSQRPEATEHAQGSYTALFDPLEPVGLNPVERFAIALHVATIHESPETITHFKARLLACGADPEVVTAAAAPASPVEVSASISPRLRAALRHAELVTRRPVDATRDDLQLLADAGLATVEIVVLSQIVAFVSFQVRVVAALQLLGAGSNPAAAPAGAPAVAASDDALPAATIIRPSEPLNSPRAFTRDQLEWEPWLMGLDMADASPSQIAALGARSSNSAYFRLLALDAEVLTARTATDLGIFYTDGGAPRADRELAAAATSRFNGCVYCASVHSRRSAQLSERNDDLDRLLDKGVEPGIDLGLDDRWQAIVDLAVDLSRTPSTATTGHVSRLRTAGLSDLGILDVAQSAAFFSWANRLMLTLGEPFVPEAS